MLGGKNIITFFTIIFFFSSLFGCAATYDHGNGVIIAEKKIKDKDYKPHDATKIGAAVGGGIGAVGGAIYGGFLGLGLGALGGVAGPMLAVTTLAGATIGSAIVGGAGLVTGAGLGYGIDVATPNAGLYHFVVKPDDGSKTFTITQYATPIPVYSRVHILEKDNTLFLKTFA